MKDVNALRLDIKCRLYEYYIMTKFVKVGCGQPAMARG